MISLATFLSPPDTCGYLPDRTWQLHYEFVSQATPAEYEERLKLGWRRFGRAWFRPQCPACTSCQPMRIDVAKFQPDRSQRRNQKQHVNATRLEIGDPTVTDDKLALYDRYHRFQITNVGWSPKPPKDAEEYFNSFADNPFPTEEWCYYRDGKLVGIGFVDALPESLSALYFFHEPWLRPLGLGTWNVLSCVTEAARRKLPFVYLGYYVKGCRSSEYKGKYGPSEVMDWADKNWKPFTR
jgi:arginine-tRNA-protein transferase